MNTMPFQSSKNLPFVRGDSLIDLKSQPSVLSAAENSVPRPTVV